MLTTCVERGSVLYKTKLYIYICIYSFHPKNFESLFINVMNIFSGISGCVGVSGILIKCLEEIRSISSFKVDSKHSKRKLV